MSLSKAGDSSALDQLARRYWREALRVAMPIVRSEADAEDVAQEALWSAFTHLSSYREDASFRSWLHRIVVNHSLMLLRRRRVHPPLTNQEMAPASASPEDLLLEAERKVLVENRLNALPNQYEKVMRLATKEEMTVEEIAKATGISAAAVKSRLHRARKLIQNSMGCRRNYSHGKCAPLAA